MTDASCTCEPRDPGGVDPGCLIHGSHPCANGRRDPHEVDSHGRCCAHCVWVGALSSSGEGAG